MKKQTKQLLILSIGSILAFQACKPDDPAPVNESELITSVVLNFTDSATQQVLSFQFNDPDGAGGNNPTVFDTLQLKANSTYFVSTLLLDESKSTVDTISNEVEEEGIEHQFFYTPQNGIALSVTYADQDVNGNPIGLATKWKTGATGSGSVLVVLKHQPGEKNGSAATGETDVEVAFPTTILN